MSDAPGPVGDLVTQDTAADHSAPDGYPTGMTACDGLCVDLLTDFDHCGSCPQACGPESDRCENGNCQCDHNKPICTGGLRCVNAQCVCVSGTQSLCSGRCSSSTQCGPGDTIEACGQQPDVCSVCGSGNPCLTPVCVPTTHSCSTQPKPSGTSCVVGSTSGRRFNSSCCTGCWNVPTGTCLSGTASGACGTGGNSCVACSTGYACIAGKCLLIQLP